MPSAKKARKTPPQAISQTGIWSHATLAMGVAGIGLITAFLLLWWQLVASSNDAHAQALADREVESFRAIIDGRIAELRTQVTTLAGAPQVLAAMTAPEGEARATLGGQLTRLVGHARRIEVVPNGQANIDQNAAVPISYAALDVINRAQSRSFVGPEGAVLEGRSHIYAAAPVTREGLGLGVLFVVLAPEFFTQALAAFDPTAGEVRIAQSLDGGPPTDVITWGTPEPNGSPLSATLANGSWSLEFTPSASLKAPIADFTDLLTAFAVAVVTLLGGISLSFSSLQRRLQQDAATLTEFASRAARGRAPAAEKYRLPLFRSMARAIAAAGPAAKTDGERSARKPAPASDAPGAEKARPPEPEPTEQAEPQDASEGDFLDVQASEQENFGIEVSEDVGPVDLGLDIDPGIFRAYDIRGVVDQNLTADVVYWIGRAFASEATSLDHARVAVGRDGRHSSPQLRDSLTKGLTDGGMDVLDIGLVPTPMLYFATHALDTGTGIMITGSHNPPEYNGLKMMIGGVTLAEERITRLYERIAANEITEGEGDVEIIDLEDHYIDRILEDVAVAQSLKVVVDCGNGAAGVVAPRLLEELGCEVVPLYCDVDGDFPNHHPDPADPANLDDLITVVTAESAQLGVAFDGDGDRLGVVTPKGEIIWPDKLLMLFAQDVVGRNPGADIIYDVKCSRHLNTIISENGGRPIMWKTGHSHIKAKMKDTGALLGGEFSGHICFGERWYGFDDAIYAAARLLEILGAESKDADELFAQFPVTFSTPEIKVPTTEEDKFKIIGRLANEADFGDGTVTSIDGVRVDYPDGWGLVRASNTSPVLTLRFEADGQGALERIQALFQERLMELDPNLRFR